MARYPRAVKPNHALDVANTHIADLGTPALADVDKFVTTANMKVGAYTLAAAAPGDGLARNVTVTHTQVGGVTDTLGTITVVGTSNAGAEISEVITPVSGTTAVGAKAFLAITSVTGAGWVVDTTADTITVGFGGLIGMPYVIRQSPALTAGTQIPFCILGTAIVVPTVVFDADEIEKCTIDASGGTFNGTKRLFAFTVR